MRNESTSNKEKTIEKQKSIATAGDEIIVLFIHPSPNLLNKRFLQSACSTTKGSE